MRSPRDLRPLFIRALDEMRARYVLTFLCGGCRPGRTAPAQNLSQKRPGGHHCAPRIFRRAGRKVNALDYNAARAV